MKKIAIVAAVVAVVVAVVLLFHAVVGDTVARGGQFLYWNVGLKAPGVWLIRAGDALAFFEKF